MSPGTAVGFFWAIGGNDQIPPVSLGDDYSTQPLRKAGNFTGFLPISQSSLCSLLNDMAQVERNGQSRVTKMVQRGVNISF